MGELISKELLDAIEGLRMGRMAIIIFFENYPSSTCLGELALNVMIRVLSIFYHVEPSDV